jgi:hypothetical protein
MDVSPTSTFLHADCINVFIATRPFKHGTEHWFPAAKSLVVHPDIVDVYAALQVGGKLPDLGAKSDSDNALAAAALARTKTADEKSIRGIVMRVKGPRGSRY